MKLSNTTMKELTARYRSVLIKCALINAAMFCCFATPANALVQVSEGFTIDGDLNDKLYEDDVEFTSGTYIVKNRAEIATMTSGTENWDTHSVTVLGTADMTFHAHSGMMGKTLTLNGGTVSLSDLSFLEGLDNFTMTNGTLNINNGFFGGEGAPSFNEATNQIHNTGGVASFSGGTVNLTSGANNVLFGETITVGNTFNIAQGATLKTAKDYYSDLLENHWWIGDKGTIKLNASGKINLFGTLASHITGNGGEIAFNSSAARLDGKLSGNTALTFNDNYALGNINSDAIYSTIKIAAGKTLDIGTSTISATNFEGGTIKAILTAAAKSSAIINGAANNVAVSLDMGQADRDAVGQYKITSASSGFTLADYSANRYAVSKTTFDVADAKNIEKLTDWTGGDLYILRLATASEATVEDLKKLGIPVSQTIEKAIGALNLDQTVLNNLSAGQQQNIAMVNDILDKSVGKVEKLEQILREIAPEAAPSATTTASAGASAVMNVVGGRMGGGSVRSGRSGGDYTVGQSSVWAQGLYNKSKLDKADGFDSDSTGFAAGVEVNVTDSVKVGLGYAYATTDITTDRSKTDVDTNTGFVYGEYKPNKFYVNGMASYGHSDYDDKTKSLGLSSKYEADTIGAQVATGYKLGLMTPEAAIRYTNVQRDEYTDSLGATMQKKTLNTWTAVGGLKLEKDYHLIANKKIGITPELKVAATYDFDRDTQDATVVLADGSSYVAQGESLHRFGVEAGAAVSVKFGNAAELALTYEGKFKKDYTDHTGMVNLKYNF